MSRRGNRKSSSGCITCKIRRVKCDETHPACHRCTSTGRKCDGYASPPMRQISIYNNRTQAQVQAFDFFTDQVVPGMTRVVHTDFWDRFLLQASQTDSTVWLATTAMSDLIRQLRPGQADRPRALSWYTRSINELQARMKIDKKWSVVCSVTAILYMCIECLLNNMTGVMGIIQKVMLQIGEVKNNAVSVSIMPLLQHISLSHGIQMPQYANDNPAMSTMDARDKLYKLLSEAHGFCSLAEDQRRSNPKDWQRPQSQFTQRDAIVLKLNSWPEIPIADKSQHTFAWACMHLARINFVIWTSVMLDDEMAFDKHHDGFEEMLEQVGIVIDAMSQCLFSFETRVIPSLGFVATRCRHPLIRRRAIRMLCDGPQIENTTHASFTMAMAKRIVAIEESGSTVGVYMEEPTSLDLPPEHDRLMYAEIEEKFDHLGRPESYLRFGRWRQHNGVWDKYFETTKV